jgi:hypothetical protein
MLQLHRFQFSNLGKVGLVSDIPTLASGKQSGLYDPKKGYLHSNSSYQKLDFWFLVKQEYFGSNYEDFGIQN